MNRIAVVILNWNGRDFLKKFLPTVVKCSQGASIFVADNGSSDDSIKVLSDEFSDTVKVIEMDKNYGFAEGYNRALRQIEGFEYFMILNSDVEVTKGWLNPLLSILDTEPMTAAIQPKVLNYNVRNKFEHAGACGGFIDTLGFPFCRGRLLDNCEVDSGQYDTTREVFWATGAAFFVRAEVFKRAGGFDPVFFAHMEEIDVCWRIKRLGYAVKVCPQSVIYHVGGGTLPVSSPKKVYLNYRNNIAMLYKNLTTDRFIAAYYMRIFTDLAQVVLYAVSAKWDFAGAILRSHRDFWKLRKQYTIDKSIPKRNVGQIFKGSIVEYYIFRSKIFKDIL